MTKVALNALIIAEHVKKKETDIFVQVVLMDFIWTVMIVHHANTVAQHVVIHILVVVMNAKKDTINIIKTVT